MSLSSVELACAGATGATLALACGLNAYGTLLPLWAPGPFIVSVLLRTQGMCVAATMGYGAGRRSRRVWGPKASNAGLAGGKAGTQRVVDGESRLPSTFRSLECLPEKHLGSGDQAPAKREQCEGCRALQLKPGAGAGR